MRVCSICGETDESSVLYRVYGQKEWMCMDCLLEYTGGIYDDTDLENTVDTFDDENDGSCKTGKFDYFDELINDGIDIYEDNED